MSNKDSKSEKELIVKIDENQNSDIEFETKDDLESELAKFRIEWKKELLEHEKKTTSTNQTAQFKKVIEYDVGKSKKTTNLNEIDLVLINNTEPDLNYQQPKSNEEKAKYLFKKGVLLEQQGRHYEAIKFYRMSMQLDADIEFKVGGHTKQKKNEAQNQITNMEEIVLGIEKTNINDSSTAATDNLETNESHKSIYEQFQAITTLDGRFCEKNTPQKTTHFSDLPMEVIMLIFKWVVSESLDMRSLDRCSAVCKGFYVCARDPEIWRLACGKIWGQNNVNDHLTLYSDWRSMFLTRPHLNFDGVYISKASYARAGEKSLDTFYSPWHLVEYYRYLRFFSDGTVLYLTSPEEPKITVAKLKNRAINTSNNPLNSYYNNFHLNEHSILRGTWTLALSKVHVVLYKRIMKATNKYSRRQTNKDKESLVEQEHIFRMEMELGSTERRLNNQLSWSKYEVNIINRISNLSNLTNFDLNRIDFPSFYFSRVKSYTINSEAPIK